MGRYQRPARRLPKAAAEEKISCTSRRRWWTLDGCFQEIQSFAILLRGAELDNLEGKQFTFLFCNNFCHSYRGKAMILLAQNIWNKLFHCGYFWNHSWCCCYSLIFGWYFFFFFKWIIIFWMFKFSSWLHSPSFIALVGILFWIIHLSLTLFFMAAAMELTLLTPMYSNLEISLCLQIKIQMGKGIPSKSFVKAFHASLLGITYYKKALPNFLTIVKGTCSGFPPKNR